MVIITPRTDRTNRDRRRALALDFLGFIVSLAATLAAFVISALMVGGS